MRSYLSVFRISIAEIEKVCYNIFNISLLVGA